MFLKNKHFESYPSTGTMHANLKYDETTLTTHLELFVQEKEGGSIIFLDIFFLLYFLFELSDITVREGLPE